MKIILSNGQEIDLPGAHFMETGQRIHHFYDMEGTGRRWLYSVSASLSFVLIANTRDDTLTADNALEYVATHIFDYKDDRYQSNLRILRSVLMRDFSARHGWKEAAEESEDTP